MHFAGIYYEESNRKREEIDNQGNKSNMRFFLDKAFNTIINLLCRLTIKMIKQ